jgi:lyso-ornithine lipid O-acyltransferase
MMTGNVTPLLKTSSLFAYTLTEYWDSLNLAKPKALNVKKQIWAQTLLSHIGLNIKLNSPVPNHSSCIYVGNHVSYLDILVLMSLVPEIVFISKSEVAKWPVIGLAAKRVGTVFIERKSKSHRKSTREQIANALKLSRTHLAVFPSGTTQVTLKKPWRWGVFEVAKNTQTPVVGFKLNYSPKRTCAYIDQDILLPHLISLLKSQELQVDVSFLNPIQISSPEQDCLHLQNWAEG